jgi:hypothetical protein
MRASAPLALIIATALIACGTTTPQGAPPIRAATGVFSGRLEYPVVDQLHHLLYGTDEYSIRMIDERTGRSKSLFRLAKRQFVYFIAIDPTINRLLIEVVHRTPRPPDFNAEQGASFADVIDAQTGRLIASAPISHFKAGPFPWEGNVAIDTSLHHGFVTDFSGAGVMVDLRSGRVLAHYHAGKVVAFGQVSSLDSFIPATRVGAVDTRIHRLFLLYSNPSTNIVVQPKGDKGWLAVIDTTTGRVVQRVVTHPAQFPRAIEVDPRTKRVFAVNVDTLTVLDEMSGRLIRTQQILSLDDLALDSAGGRLYLAGAPNMDMNSPKRLFWINTRTLRITQGPIFASFRRSGGGWDVIRSAGVTDLTDSRLFAWDHESSVAVIDSRTGRLLARRPLPPAIGRLGQVVGMLVDEGTNRLFFTGTRAVLALDTRPLK